MVPPLPPSPHASLFCHPADDVRSPIAKLDHLDDDELTDAPSEKLNEHNSQDTSNNYGELPSMTIVQQPNTPSSQLATTSDDDGDMKPLTHPEYSTQSLTTFKGEQ